MTNEQRQLTNNYDENVEESLVVPIVVFSLAAFIGNFGVAVTGFGMAIIFLLVYTIADLANLVNCSNCTLRDAVFFQTLALGSAVPIMLFQSRKIVREHWSKELLWTFIPATVVGTPIGNFLQDHLPSDILRTVVGVVITTLICYQLSKIIPKSDLYQRYVMGREVKDIGYDKMLNEKDCDDDDDDDDEKVQKEKNNGDNDEDATITHRVEEEKQNHVVVPNQNDQEDTLEAQDSPSAKNDQQNNNVHEITANKNENDEENQNTKEQEETAEGITTNNNEVDNDEENDNMISSDLQTLVDKSNKTAKDDKNGEGVKNDDDDEEENIPTGLKLRIWGFLLGFLSGFLGGLMGVR